MARTGGSTTRTDGGVPNLPGTQCRAGNTCTADCTATCGQRGAGSMSCTCSNGVLDCGECVMPDAGARADAPVRPDGGGFTGRDGGGFTGRDANTTGREAGTGRDANTTPRDANTSGREAGSRRETGGGGESDA